MHPSKAIRGKRSRLLEGKTIVLGVTGSIAAVEVVRIARELIRHGAAVRAVMSPEATRILGPEALAFATGHPPILQLSGGVEHVTWMGPGEGRADLYLIAPATANTISKIAHGIDDTVVTSFASVALGGGVPLVIAPAMHADMGRNPAVEENLEKLRSWGVQIVAPIAAEGEEKLAAPEEVAHAVLRRLSSGPWKGRAALILGGAGHEPIDDVRSITNESSGRTAVELATALSDRGADVELWGGSLRVPVPSWIPLKRWSSAAQLLRELKRHRRAGRAADAILVPAALPDYTTQPHRGKIDSRENPSLTLQLEPAPRILPTLRAMSSARTLLVGFKLEAASTRAELLARARRMLDEAHLDAVVANDATVVGADRSLVTLIRRELEPVTFEGRKEEVAGALADALAPLLPATGKTGRGRVQPARRADRPKKLRRP